MMKDGSDFVINHVLGTSSPARRASEAAEIVINLRIFKSLIHGCI